MEQATIETLLNDLARHMQGKDGQDLPDSQRAVLYACLSYSNPPYKAMADQLREQGHGSYSSNTLKNDGYLVFKRLTNALGEDIKKKNCHRKLLDWYQQQRQSGVRTSVGSAPSPSPLADSSNRLRFAGWEDNLNRLAGAIASGQRVAYIGGAVRVGKTCFTQALVAHLRANVDFDTVLWCQATDVPTIGSLCHYVVGRLSQAGINLHSAQVTLSDPAIPTLLELLQTQRLLLVIDNTEGLYCSQQLAGQFRPESMGYEHWLKRLLELPTCQGCLLWVGREPPARFDAQYGMLVWHRVEGLSPEDAAMLLAKRERSLDAIANWTDLVTFCGGNPAWLLLQAELMQGSHTSSSHPSLLLNHLSLHPNATELLQHHLSELSHQELVLLGWLLSMPLSLQQVRQLDSPDLAPAGWKDARRSLDRRSLIALDANQHYRISPPLLEYVLAEHIVHVVTAELTDPSPDNALNTLRQYPLWHGATSAQRQFWQRQHLIEPTATRFRSQYGFCREQLDRLQTLLTHLRQWPKVQQGYAVGNLLNLAIALDLPLNKLDLSELAIRHADLRSASLAHTNFDHCWLQHTLLPLNLKGRLVADMTADGKAIAIGDESGTLCYWQRHGTAFHLCAFEQLPATIDVLSFQDHQTLIAVSQQTLYQWWLADDLSSPDLLMPLPAPVDALAQGPSGQTALGLTNGQIILWHDIGYHTTLLNTHEAGVYHLTFSPDGHALVSMGMDNQGLVWNLDMANNPQQPNQALPPSFNMCLALSWGDEGPLRAEGGNSRIWLRHGTTAVQEQAIAPGELTALQFSPNGHYLAGSTTGAETTGIETTGIETTETGATETGTTGTGKSGQFFCWDWRTDTLRTMDQPYGYAQVLAVCNYGRLLLVHRDDAIQLVDLAQQTLVWQVESRSTNITAISLENTEGLNTAEQKLLGMIPSNIELASNVVSLGKRSMDSSATTTADSLS